jgi:hypothetical protein
MPQPPFKDSYTRDELIVLVARLRGKYTDAAKRGFELTRDDTIKNSGYQDALDDIEGHLGLKDDELTP